MLGIVSKGIVSKGIVSKGIVSKGIVSTPIGVSNICNYDYFAEQLL